jgi:aspartate carbamoyltransferase regulatory subunit
MFLIEYGSGLFVNAEEINHLVILKDKIEFSIIGDNEATFKVSPEFESTFLNNLQAVNDNPVQNVESFYKKLTDKAA